MSASDVTFFVEGRPIYAHRCVIMCRCEPLECMLDGPMRESLHEIVIPETKYDVFLALPEFLYCEVQGSRRSVEFGFAMDLMGIADQYLAEALGHARTSSSARLMWRTPACSAWPPAPGRAHASAARYILRHFGEVIGTPDFSDILRPLLQRCCSQRRNELTALTVFAAGKTSGQKKKVVTPMHILYIRS